MIAQNRDLDLERQAQTVLVVDDDPNVLSLTERILRDGGYTVIAVPGPLEALEKARAFQSEIHLLLADVTMPVMDGIALAQKLLAERQRIRVLLMSGNAKVESRLPLLIKPFRMAQLLEQAANVISGPAPQYPDVDVDNVRRRKLKEAVHRAES
jgi:CheY-like chemotaxis protein